MQPTASTLVLDLLSTQRSAGRDGCMPVAALVEAGELFGIAGNNLRVGLTRLCAKGLVDRDERGRYRLGAAAEPVSGQVSAWRQVRERLKPWRGDWVCVHRARGAPSSRSRAGRAAARGLRLLGFGELEEGLFIRPDNLCGDVDGVRERLRGLGLEQEAMVGGLSALDTEFDTRARSLWDGRALESEYAARRKRLSRSTRRVDALGLEQAMVETFIEGGAGLRQLALDPWLPPPLVNTEARDALIADLKAYDQLGRRYWSVFLASHGVAHARGPLPRHASTKGAA